MNEFRSQEPIRRFGGWLDGWIGQSDFEASVTFSARVDVNEMELCDDRETITDENGCDRTLKMQWMRRRLIWIRYRSVDWPDLVAEKRKGIEAFEKWSNAAELSADHFTH